MADIQYLNYGDQQIEQQALLNTLANNVQKYVASQPWSNRRKERFMSAYTDIINHGITGASNKTGQWTISIGGSPIEGLSKKDQEMYQEAAYFIQQQMSHLPVKTSEEEKKTELPNFDFDKEFTTYVNNQYGGKPLQIGGPTDQWNLLDEVDVTKGIRGTEKRANRLAELLKGYKNELGDGSKYNFENSPYKSYDEFSRRIDAAINALGTKDNISDDRDALAAIGLNYSNFFNNGSGESSGQAIQLEDGTYKTLTNAEYATYNQELEKRKKEKTKLDKLNQYNNTLLFTRGSNKFSGKNAQYLKEKYQNDENLRTALYNYSLKPLKSLTPDEYSEIYGAYKYLAKDPIDNNLLKQLQSYSSGLYKNASPNRFKKINGIDGYIWDSAANQVIQIQNREQYNASKNAPKDLFQGIRTKEEIQNTPISKEGWTSADTADVVSMIGDLVSLGGFWANVGGTATSLTSDLYADISRDKDLGSILKNIGVNLGWGIAGLLPGAKSTKLAARAARLVPKLYALYNSLGIATDPAVWESARKFTSVEGLKTVSSKDLENLKYLFHAVTGAGNIAKSHYRAKGYREQLNKQEVKTKSGTTKKISNKKVEEINEAGRKGGQKAAESKFKELVGEEAAEGQFKFSETGKSRFNPTRYSSILNKIVGNDSQLEGTQVTDLREMSRILKEDKIRPWYHWNKGYPTFELTPFRSVPPLRQKQSNSKEAVQLSKSESQRKPGNFDFEKFAQEDTQIRNAIYGNKNKASRAAQIITPKNASTSGNKMIDGSEYKTNFNPETEVITVEFKGNKYTMPGNGIHEQKLALGKFIKEQNTKIAEQKGLILRKEDPNWQAFVKSIKDLKRKGYLFKQGGRITDSQIDNFLKQYK